MIQHKNPVKNHQPVKEDITMCEAMPTGQLQNLLFCDGIEFYRGISWWDSHHDIFDVDADGREHVYHDYQTTPEIDKLWKNLNSIEDHRWKNKDGPGQIRVGELLGIMKKRHVRHGKTDPASGFLIELPGSGMTMLINDPYRLSLTALHVRFDAVTAATTTIEQIAIRLQTLDQNLGFSAENTANRWHNCGMDIASDIEITRCLRHEDWNPPGYGIGAAVMSKHTHRTNEGPFKIQNASGATNLTLGKHDSLIMVRCYDKIEELRHTATVEEKPDMAMRKIRAYQIPEKYHAYILGKTDERPETTILRVEKKISRECLRLEQFDTLQDTVNKWESMRETMKQSHRITTPNLSDSNPSRWPIAKWYEPIYNADLGNPDPLRLVEIDVPVEVLMAKAAKKKLDAEDELAMLGIDPNICRGDLVALAEFTYTQCKVDPPKPNQSRLSRMIKKTQIIAEERGTTLVAIWWKICKDTAVGFWCDIVNRTFLKPANDTCKLSATAAMIPSG